MAISSDHQRPLSDHTGSYDEAPTTAMTPEQRAQFEQDGYLIIRGALTPTEVEYYTAAIDRVYDEQRAAGAIAEGKAMHMLSAVANCPEAVGLIDHPVDVPAGVVDTRLERAHLPLAPGRAPERFPSGQPFRFEWHQDGGRQNRELEGDPRERLSVKFAFWLSDVSETGRGNFKVVPGSHKTNWIDGPPRRDVEWPEPEGVHRGLREPG